MNEPDADIVIGNQQTGTNAIEQFEFKEVPEEHHYKESEKEPKTKRGRPQEKTIDKDTVLRMLLVEILQHLEYIHNNSFQMNIRERTFLIGQKIDQISRILGLKTK